MRLRHFASIFITAFTCALTTTQVSAVDYYLNSQTGEDANSGTSPNKAWASLAKANTHDFKPGDQLLIAAGTQYTGQLKITSSGNADKPIVVARYGNGDKPRINGQGVTPATIHIENAQHLIISHLQITNAGQAPKGNRSGVRIELKDFGPWQ